MIYWVVVLGGGAVAASGYLLMFPFYGTDIAGMQLAQVVHGVVAVLFVAAMLGHIYIGTIGMEGAFEAMGRGTVDLNWAKQHHSLWLEQQEAKGRICLPALRARSAPSQAEYHSHRDVAARLSETGENARGLKRGRLPGTIAHGLTQSE